MTRSTGAVGQTPVVRIAAGLDSERARRCVATAQDAADSVPVVRTGPTGVTAVSPLVMGTLEGRTAVLSAPDESDVRTLAAALADGDLPTQTADAVIDHDPDTATLPVPATGPLSVGRRIVLGRCGWANPHDPADIEFVSHELNAGEVTTAGVLGRGRGDATADDPVTASWETARDTDGDPIVVVNANVSRDDQQADRLLLEAAPLAVLDGIAAIAEYVDATDAVLSVNGGTEALYQHLQTAVDAATDILPVVPQLVAGPGVYRAGEPTARLEALEGADRIEPRIQPPIPAKHGLHGRPTVVHTPRTVAQVRHALANPDAFDPDAADPGTRLFTVTGDVAAPAIVELPSSAGLAAVRDAVSLEGSFKTACVGGVLGGFTRDLDLAPTAQSLRAANLGTGGGVELLAEGRCVVASAGERARFSAAENSGRCVPGREGTTQLAELVREVYDGTLKPDKIRELGRVMRRTSNCLVGAHAPRPVTTALDEFEPEFRAHADGHCPSGTCMEHQ